MQRSFRLQKNRQFQYVYRRGKSAATKPMVLLYAKGNKVRIGFSVSKKVGNAVTRNLVRRRLRECFRPYIQGIKPGSYVVAARAGAAEASYQTLAKDARYLLTKLDLFARGNQTP